MKTLLILTLTFFSFTNLFAKTDTVDFWHILYNSNIIAKLSFHQKNHIIIKVDSIKTNDTLSVNYGSDRPCMDCITTIFALLPDNKRIILTRGKGWNSLKIPIKTIIHLAHENHLSNLNFHYSDPYRDTFIFELLLK